MKIVVPYWAGGGFGEPVQVSLFTHILNDNGIPALFYGHRNVDGLLDVPLFDHDNFDKHRDKEKYVRWRWTYKQKDISIMRQVLDFVSRSFDREKMVIQRDHVPVIFTEMDVPKVDVALNTRSGPSSPYKHWPYFNELKAKMKRMGMTYWDIDDNETYGIGCLNVVKKAELYLGLDSGMAHYVSKFANGKALILNGGFVSFHFWASLYDYEPIQVEDVPCRPCYLGYGSKECKYDNRCMKEITANMVFDTICERLYAG